MGWAKSAIERIERGDMTIGLLSVDEARVVPLALRKALDLGVADAGVLLADWFVRRPIGDPDVPAAESALLASIALGQDAACVQLMSYRWYYRRDDCSEQEAQQAFVLIDRWCRQHPQDHEALYLLGLVTCHGFGTCADEPASARILEQAAALGNANAMFELYIYYTNGMGVTPDADHAMAYLRQAGEAGQPRAMYNLGAFHATGRGVPLDPELAVEWYTRAAYAGNMKAAETLAVMYDEGIGVEQNDELADEFYAMLE